MPKIKTSIQKQDVVPAFVPKLEKLGITLDTKKFQEGFLASFRGKVCLYCRSKEDDEDEFGAFVHHKRSGIWIHYFCLLLASGLVQRCKDADCDKAQSPKSLYGFYIKDIIDEFKRGAKLKCTFCFKHGANIGCNIAHCKAKVHFSCGRDRHMLFQYFGGFKSFCKKHRPTQPQLLPSKIKNASCCMCFEIFDSLNNNISLMSPCCKETYFHHECVQKQALSSGLFFFRCPACNNKDEYTNEMFRMGIYIPNRDALWETPEAFSDLLENHFQCDVTECQCKHGRKHHSSKTLWEIVVCLFCGSSGSHVACSTLKNANAPFVCDICVEVHGQSGVRKKLLSMGFHANQLILDDCKIDSLKEIDTNRQNSSRKILKRKLVDEPLEKSNCVNSDDISYKLRRLK
uniref:G2/M phase-specific E3 ubiquitin-protein ligase-like n=1 Tax=Styela clava TaxID=7725 RepID=UPI00193ABC85|nr:G2/M phase-specific E3 ubiquitin-protein ligase-like [Styela clava]